MDTIEVQNQLFTGITAYDIFIGEYGAGFLIAALTVALLGNLARKYTRFNKAVETVKDFNWKFWLADNAIGMVIGFPAAWLSVRCIDMFVPIVMKSQMVAEVISDPSKVPAPILVVIVSSGVGWLLDKYIPSPSIEKLIDPEK